MPSLTVLMTTDAVGGVFTYTQELVRALRPHGVNVLLAVLGPAPSARQQRALAELPNVKLFQHPGKLEWMEEPWRDVEDASQWLQTLAARYGPDLIHLNTFTPLGHHATPRLVVAHSDVLTWWQAVKGEAAPERYRRYEELVGGALRDADGVVTATRAMLDGLQAQYGALAQARVIANARSGVFQPQAKSPAILTAGRLWDEAKNIQALAGIAARLPWPVYAAGEMGQAVVGENLHPLGRLEEREMAAWMGSSAIYAAPALYEPFGLSVLEAALSGCALVLGDIASLRELWDGAAVFVDPRDGPALEGALLGVIRDEGMRRKLQEAALRRAQQYAPEAMGAAYRAVYEELAGVRSRQCAS